MNDLLLKPEDTGEIPAVDPGPDTRNLAAIVATGPFPTLRRSPLDSTGEQPLYEPATIGLVDEPRSEPAAVLALAGYTATVDGELLPPGQPKPPLPLPVPPPPPSEPAGHEPPDGPQPYPRPNPAPPPPRGWFGRLLYRGAHRRSGR